MHADDRTPGEPDAFAEAFAAELTSAAYPVALRHVVGGTWVDLELELWRALGDVVRKRQQEVAALRPLVLPARQGTDTRSETGVRP
jgi:hypothetical protein